MFLCRRLAAAAIMVAIASTLVFFLIHLLPGDPVLLLLGEQGASNPEVVGRLRQKLNLDAPLPTQYVRWVGRIVRGDLGESFQTGLPVAQEVARRIPRSLELMVAGLSSPSRWASRWASSVPGGRMPWLAGFPLRLRSSASPRRAS